MSVAMLLAALAASSALLSSASTVIRTLDAPAVAELVGAAPRAAVLFYAPWCKYSRAFLPQFDALRTDAQGLDDITLGKLDVTQDDDSAALAKQMQVQSYPTLVLFRHGVPAKYSGEYSADDVSVALRNMGEYLVQRIDTAQQATAFLAADQEESPRVRVVGADDGTDEGTVALLLALESAATTLDERRVAFGIARTHEAASAFNFSIGEHESHYQGEGDSFTRSDGEPAKGSNIALYKPFEERRVELERPITLAESKAGAQRLKEWVGAHLRPAMVPLDPTDERQLSELYNHNFVKCAFCDSYCPSIDTYFVLVLVLL
jgi:thiol-disulfide isomerase/thioredoxin